MSSKFEYTTLAHRYTARFPALTYVGIQVNFWILANILLVTIVHMYGYIISEMYGTPVTGSFGTIVVVATMMGLIYGLGLGLAGYYLERRFFRKLSLGKVLLFKTLISIALVVVTLSLLRFVLFDIFIAPSLPAPGIALNDKSWNYISFLLMFYYFFMSLLINFINQVNKKYGPGVLLPLLLGKYRTPREEERIFMFMDLKSSTSTAERLGHLKYSAFIRDCFSDIDEVLYPHCAQIYQYVGDEVVIMWPEQEGLRNQICIKFYFAVKDQFRKRTAHYMAAYGITPVFKAGMHIGKVTAVEIGEIKRDIAYHGDTLNTAARIQSVCNEYQQDFLVSGYLMKKIYHDSAITANFLGAILLKGKTEGVEIFSVVGCVS